MFIFIDESGVTSAGSKQKYLVIACCVCGNKKFAEELIVEIREVCKARGKPILNPKEVKYHDISRYQQEIAVGLINKRYRNFYLAFVDIEKTDARMTTGKDEVDIQKRMLEMLAANFAQKLHKQADLTVIADNKLTKEAIREIVGRIHEIRGTRKGLAFKPADSRKFHGLQLADLIAGAFRAKLMKRSDLLEVDLTRIFQYSPESGQYTMKPAAPAKDDSKKK